MSSIWRRSLPKLAGWSLLIALWACTSSLWPSWPSPSAVASRLWAYAQDATFLTAFVGSLRRMAVGYALVVLLGIGGGLLLGRFRILDELVGSLAVALHAIPGAAWVPFAVLWFGMTEQAVIFTILLGATGIVVVQTDTGIRQVPPLILNAARTMGAKGVNFFWYVVVPAAVPKMVDGLRLAWAFGWRALMAGELITSVHGMGEMLSRVAKTGQIDQLVALMVVIAAVGIIVDELVFKRLEASVHRRWGIV